jgi:hypothetical protein
MASGDAMVIATIVFGMGIGDDHWVLQRGCIDDSS